MTVGRIKSFPYPERVDSLPDIQEYLKRLHRSLTEEQVERITDTENMVIDSQEVGNLTIVTSFKPTVDNAVDIGVTTYRFKDLYLSGSLKDDTVTLTVAHAKDAYDKRVDTWGDGLQYTTQTASVDYNTTNLKITSTELDTIQGISSAASPTFVGMTLVNATIADDARGLSSIHTLSANPAKSDGIALYSEGHIGAITTDGSTDGAGIWLNIDSGATLGADVRALDIGVYERGADCTGGNAYGLAIHMDFDSTNPPAAIYPFRLNCEVSGATPDALIFAANKQALGVTDGTFPGVANAYLKIVTQGGTTYRMPVVDESSIPTLAFASGSITDSSGAISFGNENLTTTGTVTATTAKLTGLTDGYVPYHVDDATGLANSPISTDGTFVSIGAAIPVSELSLYANVTPDLRVTWGADTSYGRVVFYENALPICTFQAIGTNFAVANRRLAFEIFTSEALGPILLFPGGVEAVRVVRDGKVGIGQTTFGNNATRTLALGTGVAPTTSPADCFQMYSADISGAAGKAGVHFRDEEGNIVSLGSGGIIMSGTARIKSQIPIDNANLGKGATAPTQVIIGNYNGWEYTINDDTVFTFHLPHDWASGTNVVINIDWYINEAGGDEIKWRIDWAATPHDASEAIDAPTHTGNSDTGDIVVPATVKYLTQDNLTIAGASLSAGDQVGVKLSRVAITDGTDPGNDPAVVDIHIEYTADKLGEAT